jgi:hypothetical protein
MRYVLILGLLIAGSASAQAATLYRHDAGQRVVVSPKMAQSFDAVPVGRSAPAVDPSRLRPQLRRSVEVWWRRGVTCSVVEISARFGT